MSKEELQQQRLEVLGNIKELAEKTGLDIDKFYEKTEKTLEFSGNKKQMYESSIRNALENIDEVNPNWTYLATDIYLTEMYEEAMENRGNTKQPYENYYGLQQQLVEKGVYSTNILDSYTKAEIEEAEKEIDPERDKLFTYLGIYTIATRYLATDHDKNTFELPQERWLTIALYLMQKEDKKVRMERVKEAYWALSNLYMTVATPTLANSGKSHGQLSSCFIDTIDDSLQSIYDSNTDVAKLSKNGGGIGVDDMRHYEAICS